MEHDSESDEPEEVGAEEAKVDVEVVNPAKQPQRVLRELARIVKVAKKRALSAERKETEATYRVRNGVLPAATA